jgi:putative Holliday junction resolvase
MRYLAIDYGLKRTGLAICDAGESIASPLVVLENKKQLLEKLAEIIKTETVEAIVLGLPLNMDNSTGPQARSVLKFAEKLKESFNLPIHFQDERLSTFGAEEKLTAGEFTRKKAKKRLDAVAAAEILQRFLDNKCS